jgi:anti-anti-sigma factor
MDENLRSDLVHGAGGEGFGVLVCSDSSRSRVSLHGQLDLASAPHLQQVLDQLCRDGYSEIVLDLSELEFLGVAGLTVFHRIDHQLRAVNGLLILHEPGRLARRVLAITGLDTVLTVRPATARNLSCDHQCGRRAVRTNGSRPQ